MVLRLISYQIYVCNSSSNIYVSYAYVYIIYVFMYFGDFAVSSD